MQFTLLENRSLIRLSGDDTLTFLQGLVTNNTSRLPQLGIMYAALLSPQGKFLHDFFLIHNENSVLIDCEKARKEDLIARLKFYKLRSKITIETLPDSQGVFAIWDGEHHPDPQFQCFKDPRLPALGYRAVGDISTIRVFCHQHGWTAATASIYDHMRLELGVPDGSRDLLVDKSTIIPFGFDALHGVDFSKGCYVGQEVTARTKHLGSGKKYIHKLHKISGHLPVSGTAITSGEDNIGVLCSHDSEIGLALITMEALQKTQQRHASLNCGNAIINVELPTWSIVKN